MNQGARRNLCDTNSDLDAIKSLVDRQLTERGCITLTATASPENDAILQPLLNPQESNKANRFIHPKDRNMSRVAHGLKRMAFNLALGLPVEQLIFGASKNGKPHCCSDERTKFSLSHAGGKVAVTLSTDREVGVDIDFPRSEKYTEIAYMVLSLTEQEEFRKSQFNGDFFIRRWTQKEAISKACGLGLAADFTSFSANDCQQPVFCPASGTEFYVETTALFGGYVSVACVGGKPQNLIVDLDPFLLATRPFAPVPSPNRPVNPLQLAPLREI
jgi:phosphopantetheinyl transferase